MQTPFNPFLVYVEEVRKTLTSFTYPIVATKPLFLYFYAYMESIGMYSPSSMPQIALNRGKRACSCTFEQLAFILNYNLHVLKFLQQLAVLWTRNGSKEVLWGVDCMFSTFMLSTRFN